MLPVCVTKPFLCLLAAAVWLAGCGGGESTSENPITPVTFALSVPADTPATVELALVGTTGALGAERASGLLLQASGALKADAEETFGASYGISGCAVR
jgi:hypothetical protein